MLVVTELVSIVSEKVTETFDVIETEVSPSEGELDDTVGGLVSVVVVVESSVVASSEVVLVLSVLLVVVVASSLLQELTVNIKIMERIMRIYLKELPVSGLGIY